MIALSTTIKHATLYNMKYYKTIWPRFLLGPNCQRIPPRTKLRINKYTRRSTTRTRAVPSIVQYILRRPSKEVLEHAIECILIREKCLKNVRRSVADRLKLANSLECI